MRVKRGIFRKRKSSILLDKINPENCPVGHVPMVSDYVGIKVKEETNCHEFSRL